MNVGGAVADGFVDDLIDKAHDRGVLGHVFDVVDLAFVDRDFFFFLVLHQAFHGVGAYAVILADGLADFLFAGDGQFDFLAQHHAQVVQQVDVERIVDGDAQNAHRIAQGNDGVMRGDLGRDLADGLGRDFDFADFDIRRHELLAQRLEHRLLVRQIQFDENLADSLARFLRLGGGILHVLEGHGAHLDQNVSQPSLAFGLHHRVSTAFPGGLGMARSRAQGYRQWR
ncbi:MAG: hypothetical protein BWZ10_00130 [candidate division BRC1 bacterium ADurb.BinA364]|nr:MAG: hypothetical protein BWZ10_00130 [candidate division BRC1 bacterium ADurb.BinA364]